MEIKTYVLDFVASEESLKGFWDKWDYRKPGIGEIADTVVIQHRTDPLEISFPMARRDVDDAQHDSKLDTELKQRIRKAIANPMKR